MAGALLLMLLGIMLPLSAAAFLLVGLAFFFNWLLRHGKGTGSAMPAPRAVPPPPLRHPAPTGPAAVTHSFTGVLTAFFVIAVALVVPYSFSRFQTPSASVVPAPAPVAAIAPVNTSESPASAGNVATAIPPAGTTEVVASGALPNTPAERRRLLAEFAAQVGRLFGRGPETSEPTTAPSGGAPVSLGESRNGEVVVLELTQPMVRQLLGEAAGDLLQDMQSRLPQDIRESYALIPLGSSLGNALPPVPPRLAASGLSSLADSLVSILSTEGTGVATIPETPPPTQPRPAWIDNPPPDSRVVRITQVGNISVEQERTERLTFAARELLLEQATTEQLSREYHAVIRTLPINPQDYLLTPPWSETEEADLGSASGKQPVTTEYHLVSLPQDTAAQNLPGVADRVRSLRTIGIAGCTATFWLGLLALTICSPMPAAGRLPRAWINRLGVAAAGMLLVATVFLGTLVGNGRLAERTADILDDQSGLGR
ncbi:MAG: hypothetical protein ACKOEO_24400 [Planctomycetaceae bacterium]